MSDSALLGHPPLSANDNLVYKGLLEISPSIFEALPHLAATGNHHSRATSMFIGGSFAISFALIITAGRIVVRWKMRSLSVDDYVLLPACVGFVVCLSIVFASETVGCLGRHIYTCTYKELGVFYKVSSLTTLSNLSIKRNPLFRHSAKTCVMAIGMRDGALTRQKTDLYAASLPMSIIQSSTSRCSSSKSRLYSKTDVSLA